MVLYGKSEILDLGRTKRLHNAAQRKAIRLQHHQCQADGCTHHHHRAHDTRYLTQLLPNGDHRFTRRV